MVTWEECQLLLSGTNENFDQVMKGKGDIPDREISKLREGDLILRNMKGDHSLFYHAGIYCGNEEVIEFFAASEQSSAGFSSCSSSSRSSSSRSSSSCSSSSGVDGGVSKAHVNNYIDKLPYVVLRLKNPIPKDFAERVKKAMKSKKKYHVLMYNCLHFALELLGLTTLSLPQRQ